MGRQCTAGNQSSAQLNLARLAEGRRAAVATASLRLSVASLAPPQRRHLAVARAIESNQREPIARGSGALVLPVARCVEAGSQPLQLLTLLVRSFLLRRLQSSVKHYVKGPD